jgi:hypothetical protein
VPPSINAFDPHFHNTYQHQANVQVQRDLGKGYQLTVGYQYGAQRHGLYSHDINLTETGQFLADGRPVFAGTAHRPNPSFGAINLITSGATTNFNGGILTLQKRLASGLEFTANYMYSHALASNLGEGGSGEDPTNVHRDYGNADDDVRNNFAFQGLYQPAFQGQNLHWLNGFELSTIAYVNSGFPINVTAGTDLNNDGIVNDRPLFEARNSYTGRGLKQVSAQVKRYYTIRDRYQMAAYISAENLFNTNNLSCGTSSGCTGAVINTANSSDLFREISAGTARNVQLGFSVKF